MLGADTNSENYMSNPQDKFESHNNPNVDQVPCLFNRQSFQDFSMKKFTELLDEEKMNQFMDSVQRTFRDTTKEDTKLASPDKILSQSTEKRKPIAPSIMFSNTSDARTDQFKSPQKQSRRAELELDSFAGSQLKVLSEKKKILDQQ